ncbi:unnamed protein product [Trichogramma brassicae]|uniref:Uncharacterized protein n=1 Tax=Trichogramma brassicae TaxID=86971 RepID=A0A6H5IW25_9HYME|nr:unnamed protein product [Trichogramma brassicae]
MQEKICKDIINTIKGFGNGQYTTLGRVIIHLMGSPIALHVVPADVPISAHGIIGWDTIDKYGGIVSSADNALIMDESFHPFINITETVELPPRSRKTIAARVINEEPVGMVPLQNLGEGILFGNFIGTKTPQGHVLAECINTTDETIIMPRPRQAKLAQDKEKFDNESSSDSDDSLLPAAKFGAVEESSNDNESDVDVDGDVSMAPLPERAAKARARKKISEIMNAGKIHRKPAIPPSKPVIQVENSDLPQMECTGVQNDFISFQEDPGDPTPAPSVAQSSIENENLPPNDVRGPTFDPNEQSYVRRSFPEIAREISAKLRVDLRKNPAPNRRGLQIDIWEVGSDDDRPREVDEQNIECSTSANDTVWLQDIEQPRRKKINNDTRFAKNFDELADATKEYRDPNHRANLRIRRLPGYSEHEGCAETHATLMRSDDIPDKPPGNCLFYSLLKIFKSDLTAWE